MSQQYTQPKSRDAFEVAIICALRTESDAVEGLFDQFWEEEEKEYSKITGDPNSYTLGRIGRHNVVLAYMPGMGKAASATLAAAFRITFPSIRIGLIVGVCGGIPRDESSHSKILLGDIIISTGVIQYDFGRQLPNEVARKDTLEDNLGRPNSELRGFLHKIQGWKGRNEMRRQIIENIADICSKPDFKDWKYPGVQYDHLFPPTYRHKHQGRGECNICEETVGDEGRVCDIALSSDCTSLKCDIAKVQERDRVKERTGTEEVTQQQQTISPLVHFGLVASGDLVMKSAKRRNELAARDKVIAFEMEGSGAWDAFPTIVIKAVCDYADSHKNRRWQKYAAITAAACAKAFLRQWRGVERHATTSSGKSGQQDRASANIHQSGNTFGTTTVSGGTIFQGNYTAL